MRLLKVKRRIVITERNFNSVAGKLIKFFDKKRYNSMAFVQLWYEASHTNRFYYEDWK